MGELVSNTEKATIIIQGILAGGKLKDLLPVHGLSAWQFHQMLSRQKDLAASYARAREFVADLLVEEAIEAVDDPNRDPSQARNQMEIRRWIASKWHSRVYGERVDLNVTQTLSVTDALAEARSRISLPNSYQAPVIDAQLVDIPALCDSDASDSQSEDRPPAGPDSIFD